MKARKFINRLINTDLFHYITMSIRCPMSSVHLFYQLISSANGFLFKEKLKLYILCKAGKLITFVLFSYASVAIIGQFNSSVLWCGIQVLEINRLNPVNFSCPSTQSFYFKCENRSERQKSVFEIEKKNDFMIRCGATYIIVKRDGYVHISLNLYGLKKIIRENRPYFLTALQQRERSICFANFLHISAAQNYFLYTHIYI